MSVFMNPGAMAFTWDIELRKFDSLGFCELHYSALGIPVGWDTV